MWDDSDMAPAHISGRCLNSWQASKRLKDGSGGLQEVVIPLAHDTHLAGAHPRKKTTLLCFLRRLLWPASVLQTDVAVVCLLLVHDTHLHLNGFACSILPSL